MLQNLANYISRTRAKSFCWPGLDRKEHFNVQKCRVMACTLKFHKHPSNNLFISTLLRLLDLMLLLCSGSLFVYLFVFLSSLSVVKGGLLWKYEEERLLLLELKLYILSNPNNQRQDVTSIVYIWLHCNLRSLIAATNAKPYFFSIAHRVFLPCLNRLSVNLIPLWSYSTGSYLNCVTAVRDLLFMARSCSAALFSQFTILV